MPHSEDFTILRKEIEEMKTNFNKLLGVLNSNTPASFSEEALERAADNYRQMTSEREQWVTDENINTIIKTAPYKPGKFLRKHLGFKRFFKHKHDILYWKNDLIALNVELEKRNIDLALYEDLLEEKREFEKNLAMFKEADKAGKEGRGFTVPPGAKNVFTSPIPNPDPELVRKDFAKLEGEFIALDYVEYIDVHNGRFAMVKHMPYLEKYLTPPGLKRSCQRWCNEFNSANEALKIITGKDHNFNVKNIKPKNKKDNSAGTI